MPTANPTRMTSERPRGVRLERCAVDGALFIVQLATSSSERPDVAENAGTTGLPSPRPLDGPDEHVVALLPRDQAEARLCVEELHGSGSQVVTSFDRAATSPTDSSTTRPSLQSSYTAVSSVSDGESTRRHTGLPRKLRDLAPRLVFAPSNKEQRW
jgi:hypothetical protein